VFGFEEIREPHRLMEANAAYGKMVVVHDAARAPALRGAGGNPRSGASAGRPTVTAPPPAGHS
jgi:hypothetical protein